jgi:Coenzyme PQQ synthesis protein D (PqqD)
MDDHQTYQINAPAVAYQHVEDEAILIQFDSGCYYSTDKVGAEILSLLQQSVMAITIVRILAERYCADFETIDRMVKPFLEHLCAEDLVVAQAGAVGVGASEPPSSAPTGSARQRLPIEAPVLHKYTDLQDLLLLDPIHDTDEAGWPVAEPNRWRAG